ncbi:MAG: alanine-glyoxylate transaminase/serine-glyoxylate transaminase/serine-pyruvate transaminase [Bradymonadia bacterium]
MRFRSPCRPSDLPSRPIDKRCDEAAMTPTFTSFHPPHRTLMGPGPSDIHPRVLQAMARPTIGHLDPAFIGMMDELKTMLRLAFRTQNALTFPVSGPGTAGMETCIANLIEPGDTAIICRNGVFGARLEAMTGRVGGIPICVDAPWGAPVDPAAVEQALRDNPNVKCVVVVHAETSTGARSDVEAIAKIAHAHGALIIVDAVTSLAGTELEVDAWQLDAVYSGSQKCLSAPPGLSPVTFSERAIKAVEDRKTPVVSWFLDIGLIKNYWSDGGTRSYHHTAPVNALYGLHESLVLLHEEGLEASHARHLRNHEALRDGLETLGLSYVVDPEWRLPQLNAVRFPEGTDDAATRGRLLNEFDLEIGGGLGDLAGKVWRIGLMGHTSRAKNVHRCLAVLKTVLG